MTAKMDTVKWIISIVLLVPVVMCTPRDCRYGKRCVFPCHCQYDQECDVNTGKCPSGCDEGYMGLSWEGETCQFGNIAYGKPTTQTGTNGAGTSDLAVDGFTATNASERNCARVQNPDHSPAEWTVDLAHLNLVKSLLIYSTYDPEGADTLTNFSFIVRNETGPERVCLAYKYRAPMGYQATLSINCIPPAVGSQVVLRRFGKIKVDRMTLCEVAVMGHRYIDCSNCPSSCDTIRGCTTCPSGTRLPDCSQPCLPGLYGTNCQQYCENCALDTTCRPTDGKCIHGCKPGWFGARCNIQHGSVGDTTPRHNTVTGYTNSPTPRPTWVKPRPTGGSPQATGPMSRATDDIVINPVTGSYSTIITNLTDTSSGSLLRHNWISLFLVTTLVICFVTVVYC